jgi:CRP-like cAMP-binding protein
VKKILQVLDDESASITVMQLQGYVFFANSMDIFLKVGQMLDENKKRAADLRASLARRDSRGSRSSWDRDGDSPDKASIQSSNQSNLSGSAGSHLPLPAVMRYLVLDFTLVQSIDSSAAESIAKIYELCAANKVRLVYSTGPVLCRDFRMKRLELLVEKSTAEYNHNNRNLNDITSADDLTSDVHVCDSMDRALAWCEDCIIRENAAKLESVLAAEERSLSSLIDTDRTSTRLHNISHTYLNLFTGGPAALFGRASSKGDGQTGLKKSSSDGSSGDVTAVVGATIAVERKKSFFQQVSKVPPHMLQLLALCPDEPKKVEKLVGLFERQSVSSGTYLWKIGDDPDFCLLLSEGCLVALADEPEGGLSEEEAGEEILVGHLVGEYSLLMNSTRQGSLRAAEDSIVYVLRRGVFDEMEDDLRVLLYRICLQYLGHRTLHVSNRLLESKCVPI